MWPTQEAGAIDHVGITVEDRREQARVLARVVLKVSILDQEDVAGRGAEAGS